MAGGEHGLALPRQPCTMQSASAAQPASKTRHARRSFSAAGACCACKGPARCSQSGRLLPPRFPVSRQRIYQSNRTEQRRCSHTEPLLLQTYMRDTGEILNDLSMPIYVDGKHWGAFIMGFDPRKMFAE